MKKRKISFKKIIRFVLILIIIAAIGFGCFWYFNNEDTTPIKKKVKVEDEIKEYGYKMDDNETKYYKGLFKELKSTLESDKVDYDKYAKLLSQLFIADFMNLDNKTSKNDIGGVQFVYTDFQSDFTKLARDGIYSSVAIDKSDKQEMPEVTKVEVTNLEHIAHKYLDKTDEDAISIELKITYKTDLDYQSTTNLILVHNDKKLEIVKMTEK